MSTCVRNADLNTSCTPLFPLRCVHSCPSQQRASMLLFSPQFPLKYVGWRVDGSKIRRATSASASALVLSCTIQQTSDSSSCARAKCSTRVCIMWGVDGAQTTPSRVRWKRDAPPLLSRIATTLLVCPDVCVCVAVVRTMCKCVHSAKQSAQIKAVQKPFNKGLKHARVRYMFARVQ